MRVFLTGASGWIGSATIPELIDAGHQVVGLARSDASAEVIVAAGAEVLRGSLEDLESLRNGAARADAVIHLGFIHDFSQYEAANQIDREAIEAMAEVMAGTDRPLLIASGTGAVKSGDMATENDPPLPGFPRSQATIITVQLAERGIRTSVVRLPPTVHGPGDKGFVATLVDTARQHGESAYIGEGANRWPAVHRLDAARLLRLAVDRAPAGSILHAVADEAVPTRAIAESIGRHLDVPVVSIRPEEAFGHFGFVGTIFGIDASASSAITRDLLGWQPQHPGLLEDLDLGHYFV